MPIFITQGRVTQDSIVVMMARPEDRSTAAAELPANSQSRQFSHCMISGDYDRAIAVDGPIVQRFRSAGAKS